MLVTIRNNSEIFLGYGKSAFMMMNVLSSSLLLVLISSVDRWPASEKYEEPILINGPVRNDW